MTSTLVFIDPQARKILCYVVLQALPHARVRPEQKTAECTELGATGPENAGQNVFDFQPFIYV